MKKAIFTFYTVFSLFFCSMQANRKKTNIYLTNKTGQTLTLGDIKKETGFRIVPSFKTKAFKGTYDIKKYHNIVNPEKWSCKVSNALAIPPQWKCTSAKREVLPSSVKKTTLKSKKTIANNETIKVTTIDRAHASIKMVNWAREFKKYPNPSSSKFRTALSTVFPYETLTTKITGPSGTIDYVFSAERIGLASDYAKAINQDVKWFFQDTMKGGGITAVSTLALGSGIGAALLLIGSAVPMIGVSVIAGTMALTGGIMVVSLSVAGVKALVGEIEKLVIGQQSALFFLPVITGEYKTSEKLVDKKGPYDNLYITITRSATPK